MSEALQRIAYMALVGFIIWFFHEPAYIFLLIGLACIRKNLVRKNVHEHFQDVHAKLDAVILWQFNYDKAVNKKAIEADTGESLNPSLYRRK